MAERGHSTSQWSVRPEHGENVHYSQTRMVMNILAGGRTFRRSYLHRPYGGHSTGDIPEWTRPGE